MRGEIAVVGTIFMDCKGFADEANGDYNPIGRNTGNVCFVHGGVGRNVAENLAGLGHDVLFASTVDQSDIGRAAVRKLKKQHINVDFVLKEKNNGMGIWMVVLNRKGEQVGSLSRMPNVERLERALEEHGKKLFRNVDAVALEIDLSPGVNERTFEWAEKYRKPVYALPANLHVLLQHPEFLPRLSGFICNQVEIGRLFGFASETMEAEELLETSIRHTSQCGLPLWVITMGDKGAIYYDAGTGEKGYVPAVKTEVQDVCGAGDSFFSGTLSGILAGKSLREAVEMGGRLASLTIQVPENCFPAIKEYRKFIKRGMQ